MAFAVRNNISIVNLEVDYMVEPIGVDVETPRFSWRMTAPAGGRGYLQKAYQIIVIDSTDHIVWDSGKVSSGISVAISYAGTPLQPATRYYWTVKIWDQNSNTAEASSWFETGLMSKDGVTNWDGAKWIYMQDQGASPMFRTETAISGEKTVIQARLYITALGIYEAYINGNKVKLLKDDGSSIEEIFNPGWTDYLLNVNYQTYDVTSYITDSKIVLGAMVGKGWYAGEIGRIGRYKEKIGSEDVAEMALLAKLKITYTDGTSDVIVTNDTAWKASSYSPILQNDFFAGETYDANIAKEVSGWSTVGYNDCDWEPVAILDYQGEVIGSRASVPRIAEERELKPISAYKYSSVVAGENSQYFHGHVLTEAVNVKADIPLAKDETIILNMGQNMVGVPYIMVTGGQGTTVTIRSAEMLNDGRQSSDGPKDTIYQANLRGAKNTDRYIMSGDPQEKYQPRFTFRGYQYLEISADADIIIQEVAGKVITSVGKQTGHIETSNSDVNQLFNNILWGQMGNYLSIFTDCPQRNERTGWTGDAQLFGKTGMFNFDVIPFTENYIDIMNRNRAAYNTYGVVMPPSLLVKFGVQISSGWSDAGIIIPWLTYQKTGDIKMLQVSFDDMDAYMDRITEEGYHTTEFGDWLAFEGTSLPYMNAIYRVYTAQLMIKISTLLGKSAKIAKYKQMYNQTRATFIDKYVTEQGQVLTASADNFTQTQHGYPAADNAQTGLLWALKLKLYETEIQKETMIKNLIKNVTNESGLVRPGYAENTLAVGFLGVHVILPVLTEIGASDKAYALLCQDAMPSWLYSVKNGATTIWERWNSYSIEEGFGPASMNSFNHFAYGAVAEWMYESMLGISTASPGYKNVNIAPEIDLSGRITYAKGYFDSRYGRIASEWKIVADKVQYNITVPANTIATVSLPANNLQEIQENNLPLTDVAGVVEVKGMKDGKAVFVVASGEYEFIGVMTQ